MRPGTDGSDTLIPSDAVLRCPHELLIRNWLLNMKSTLICVDSFTDCAFLCYGYNQVTKCASGVVIPPEFWSSVYKYVISFNTVGNLPIHINTEHRNEEERQVVEKAKGTRKTQMKRYRHASAAHGSIESYIYKRPRTGDSSTGTSVVTEEESQSSAADESTAPDSAFAPPANDASGAPVEIKDDPLCAYKPTRYDLKKNTATAFTSELFHRVPHTFKEADSALAHVCSTNFNKRARHSHGLFGMFVPDGAYFRERLASFTAFMAGAPPLPTTPEPAGYKHIPPASLIEGAQRKRKQRVDAAALQDDESSSEDESDDVDDTIMTPPLSRPES